jgi:protein-arginine kinase activator protein McsA
MREILCESCGHDVAEIVVCFTSGTRRTERNLCRRCARDSERILFGDGELLIADTLELLATERQTPAAERDRTKVCPNCGNTVDDVLESGVAGCPTCYKVLRSAIDLAIDRWHGGKS